MKMLRITRKQKGFTMKALGDMIGVSESAISQYETGKRESDFETLLKLSEVLDCSVDYLLRGEPTKKNLVTISDDETSSLFDSVDKDFEDAKKALDDVLAQLDSDDLAYVQAYAEGLIVRRKNKDP